MKHFQFHSFYSRVHDTNKVPEKKVHPEEPKPTVRCPKLLESCTLEDIKGEQVENKQEKNGSGTEVHGTWDDYGSISGRDGKLGKRCFQRSTEDYEIRAH